MFNILNVLLSPASALILALLGYYSFAGFTSALLPEGDLGGILIRVGILTVITIAFFRKKFFVRTFRYIHLPVILFLSIYLFRLFDNIYLSGITIEPGVEIIFFTFILGGIFPAFVLSRIIEEIEDRQFIIITTSLCIIFLIGMYLNMDALQASAGNRMKLEKMNPISMSYTAASFLIFYLIFFQTSKRSKIEALILVPLLLLIIVYARSRGAYATNTIAIGIYLLLLRGTRRMWMIAGLAVLVFGFLATFGTEQLDVVLESLDTLSSTDDTSKQRHMLAWQGAWQQFLDDMIFGRYAIELQTNYYPHNIYLESLMAVGLFGSIPFIIHFYLAVKASVGIIRSQHYPLFATFIAVLFFRDALAAAGAGGLWGANGYWITSIMVVALWYGYPPLRNQQQNTVATVKQW